MARPASRPRGWDTVAEQIARDYLNDRRSERRWRIFFRFAWLLLAAMLILRLATVRNHAAVGSCPHFALTGVRGEIAFQDPGAQAVVLRLNSPGGSLVQAGMLNDEIVRLKALHRRKVYAVVEESCASGAHYIAVAADEIYADQAFIVGPIRVLMDGFGFTGAMDKFDIERRLLTALADRGRHQGPGRPFQATVEPGSGLHAVDD